MDNQRNTVPTSSGSSPLAPLCSENSKINPTRFPQRFSEGKEGVMYIRKDRHFFLLFTSFLPHHHHHHHQHHSTVYSRHTPSQLYTKKSSRPPTSYYQNPVHRSMDQVPYLSNSDFILGCLILITALAIWAIISPHNAKHVRLVAPLHPAKLGDADGSTCTTFVEQHCSSLKDGFKPSWWLPKYVFGSDDYLPILSRLKVLRSDISGHAQTIYSAMADFSNDDHVTYQRSVLCFTFQGYNSPMTDIFSAYQTEEQCASLSRNTQSLLLPCPC